jgi:hypothetical protein
MLLKAWKQISDRPSYVYKHTVYQMPGSQTPLLLFGPCHPHWVRQKNLSAQLVSFEFESVMLKKK